MNAVQALPAAEVWTPLQLLKDGHLEQLQYQPMLRAVRSQQALIDDAFAKLPAEALIGADHDAFSWAMSVHTSLLSVCPRPRLASPLEPESMLHRTLYTSEMHDDRRSCSPAHLAQQRRAAASASACSCRWRTC